MNPLRGGAAPSAIAALLAVACAGGPSGEAPLELRDLMKREVVLPAPAPVASADGAIRARVAGRLVGAFEKTPDRTWFGEFDIGTHAPVKCQVFEQAKDPASALIELSESLFTGTGRTRKVESREILTVDVGNAGPYPYLSFDWVAKIDGLAHQIKQKLATRGDRSLYCVHDESGYATAFEQFFAGFLTSLEIEEGAPTIYREVVVLSIAGHQVGYNATRVTRDADGDYRTDTQGAMLIPTGSDEAMASDDQSVEFSRSDGSVINQVWLSSDGRDLTRLDLDRSGGAWKVTGQMQGKAVSERFEGNLTSAVDETRRILRVARGEIGEQRYVRWLGTLSPGKPLAHVMTKTGASTVRVAAGPVKVDFEVDERGATRGSMHMGRLEIATERVYVDGSL
jgi:hypothetical protein